MSKQLLRDTQSFVFDLFKKELIVIGESLSSGNKPIIVPRERDNRLRVHVRDISLISSIKYDVDSSLMEITASGNPAEAYYL